MRQYLRFVERLGAQQTHKQHTTIIVNAPFGCFVWVLSTMSTVSTVGASCAIAGSLGPPQWANWIENVTGQTDS